MKNVATLACGSALLCAAVFATGVHSVHAGMNVWTSHGPKGGPVDAVAVDPSTPGTVYAGVFKSTNGGATWNATPLADAIRSSSVGTLAVDPATPGRLYAGTEFEVFKSADGGDTWISTSAGLPTAARYTIEALAIMPTVPSTLYLGLVQIFDASGGGVFKSTDSGDTWIAVNTGLPMDNFGGVPALAIDPTAPTTLYASTRAPRGDDQLVPIGTGIFKTIDGGATWNATGLDGPMYVSALAIDPATPSTLYAGTFGGGVLRSVDGGDTWMATNTGLPTGAGGLFIAALAIDPTTTSTVYAGMIEYFAGYPSGVFKSTDSGDTWTAFNDGLTNTNVIALAADPTTPGRLYAGTLFYPGTFPGGVFSIQAADVCVGDCDGDGRVTINELVLGVNIAMDQRPTSACRAFVSSEERVDVAQLTMGVRNALHGCGD